MKIAILGSTGFVGKVLINKAIVSGYQIKTLARHPEKLDKIKDSIEIIKGSVFDPLSIQSVIEGSEVVLSAIGPPTRGEFDPLLYEKAMQDIIKLMRNNGVKRYIHIGGAAHNGGENENWPFKRRFLKQFLNLVGKKILIAKELEWNVLKSSDLDWTLIRPPRIANEKASGNIFADEKNLHSLKVSVGDLTDFMLDQISSKDWIRKAPLVSSN